MTDNQPQYLSFLIRLWSEQGDPNSRMRVVALDPRTGERWGFADWDELLAFLKERLDRNSQEGT